MRASSLKIGQILINMGAITPDQLDQALSMQKSSNMRLGEILINEKMCTEEKICLAFSKQFSIPYVDLDEVELRDELSTIITAEMAEQCMVVPLELIDRTLTIAVSDPLDYKGLNRIQTTTKYQLQTVIAAPSQIRKAHQALYASKKAYDEAREFIAGQVSQAGKEDEIEAAKNAADDQPIIRFVNNMIEEAVRLKTSDIHIEPMEETMVIRFRIDGKLQKYMETSAQLAPSVTSRIKFIGGMNIAEKRIPQDGRINYRVGTTEVDMRISILPVVHGEKVCARITTALGLKMDKSAIGFLPENLAKFDHLLEQNRGIILVTGATGSGKSTTLYTGLKGVMREDINIVTVENPVEMIIPGINQVDINEKAGLTFAGALRSILRQDPDIIMIGEIRDKETAEIAASASITGHLVLSTLHTYNAASSIIRLVDMGIEPFMVSSSVIGVIAQRLVRRLCVNCKQPYIAGPRELELLGIDDDSVELRLYRAPQGGCEKCNRSGHKGRLAVHEILMVSNGIKRAIQLGKSTEDINQIAVEEGMIPMRENLRMNVISGVISLETMLEAASEDML
ncbi:MAG: Flp pilus assembly complex ATPase component TadA [Lachnospiraceae bacterium]|nr:Flp pilus assembly complex ATPase component TadA [Lachnospiraceae bacterium]